MYKVRYHNKPKTAKLLKSIYKFNLTACSIAIKYLLLSSFLSYDCVYILIAFKVLSMCGHTLTYLEVAIKINKPHDRFLITSIFESYKPRKPFLRVCQAHFFPYTVAHVLH